MESVEHIQQSDAKSTVDIYVRFCVRSRTIPILPAIKPTDNNQQSQPIKEYRIVAHVHDEVILEVPMETSLDSVCELMGRTPPWVPGLELRADGYECMFYQKA